MTGEQPLVSRLRAVIAAKDEQIAVLQAQVEAALARLGAAESGLRASRERERRLELRVAELERRLSMDSTDFGTPSSKERIGAKEARRARQESGRERSRKTQPRRSNCTEWLITVIASPGLTGLSASKSVAANAVSSTLDQRGP